MTRQFGGICGKSRGIACKICVLQYFEREYIKGKRWQEAGR
ncbi:hypothetical protein HMPREF0581_0004 [Mogibacterium timidum ATCC 33093]|uniref:Uncharacterized protein n=1 Tax=Mogibacterium timidum ATCC 33093 TaxID=1401079 RepID=X8IV92_9FIRM|nr:hypothetical protein HMPREF0581_0004 [Mogibacterium timidum ATCC 33093]